MKQIAKEEEFRVLYEDNHLLMVNKSPDLLTQSTSLCSKSLEQKVFEYLQRDTGKRNPFLQVLHRLDRPVSGIVVFARSSKMLGKFNDLQRKRAVDRYYLAIVEGYVQEDNKTLVHHMIHDSYRARLVDANHPDAKKAILEMHVKKRRDKKTLLSLKLITGRYHQIRLQLAAIGHPIVGDRKYKSLISADRLYLHHERLAFCHPVTQKEISVVAPAPFDL